MVGTRQMIMISKFNTTLKGLFFSIAFYCSFPVVYLFLLPSLMYGNDQVLRSIAFTALFLLAVFVLISVLFIWISIRQVKASGSYSAFGSFAFFTLLLFISYPLVFFSPFIELHVFNLNMLYEEALVFNLSFGSVFLLLGIVLDILKYRINKLKSSEHPHYSL